MRSLSFPLPSGNTFGALFQRRSPEFWIGLLATITAVIATCWAYQHDTIVAYGDAESHLNIAKRVVSNLTPGVAQLGGIWLPLPHLLMVPFVTNDFLWRSGLAGSIIGGLAYVISAIYLYKLVYLLTRNRFASVAGAFTFMFNPAVLYLQTTPMTELPLIVFFILSSYYFIRFILDRNDFPAFVAAAGYGFCATLTRYDGWFLVAAEAGVLALMFIPQWWRRARVTTAVTSSTREAWSALEGRLILFCTIAFFGILLWLGWDALILGDPLYFTHSQFSASSQQQGWLARGELPAYHDLWVSVQYYFVTAMNNSGVLLFLTAIVGFTHYILRRENRSRGLVAVVMAVPFLFYVVTLFLGQSVIFIPHLTPVSFEWRLFNVRYGVMMVPFVALCLGYLFAQSRSAARWALLLIFVGQLGLYGIGYSPVLSYRDGVTGLSASKRTDAEGWMREHYDDGLVLMDDFARTMSVIRSGIPMQKTIYIGNKPFWEESLQAPETHATWIIMQEDDTVWQALLDGGAMEQRLYTHFTKVYTSPKILIFRRQTSAAAL